MATPQPTPPPARSRAGHKAGGGGRQAGGQVSRRTGREAGWTCMQADGKVAGQQIDIAAACNTAWTHNTPATSLRSSPGPGWPVRMVPAVAACPLLFFCTPNFRSAPSTAQTLGIVRHMRGHATRGSGTSAIA